MSYKSSANSLSNPCDALVMPASVLIESIRLARAQCPANQEGHPAVKCLTDWWNANAEKELRSAYAFSLYVRYGVDWLAGDPEECWVSAEQWERGHHPGATASLLGGRVSIVFVKRSLDEAHGFDAKCVDGSEGTSGGRWPEITGDGILTRYSHEALELFPSRFPDAWWELILAQVSVAETEHEVAELATITRSYVPQLGGEDISQFPEWQALRRNVDDAVSIRRHSIAVKSQSGRVGL